MLTDIWKLGLLLIPALVAAENALFLGHSATVNFVGINGNRAVSQDYLGNWVLWNLETRTALARGLSPSVEMAGKTLLYRLGNAARTADLETGKDAGTIPDTTAVRLSWDGTKIWSGGRNGLKVWSSQGNALVSLPGDFTGAVIEIFGDTLTLANHVQDSLVLISLASGQRLSARKVDGNFHSWFLDRRYFMSLQGTVVRIYGRTGERIALMDAGPGEVLQGSASYFWTFERTNYPTYPMRIFDLRSPGKAPRILPQESVTGIFGSTNSIAVTWSRNTGFVQIRLLEDSVRIDSCLRSTAGLTAFAGDSSGNWIAGNENGVVEAPQIGVNPRESRPLNPGQVRSVAGSNSDRFAVTTASGVGYVFRIEAGIPKLTGTLPNCGGKARLTADGKTLYCTAAHEYDNQYLPDRTLSAYGMEGLQKLKSWPYSVTAPSSEGYLWDFDISADGKYLVRELGNTIEDTRLNVTDASTDSVALDSIPRTRTLNAPTVFPGAGHILVAGDTLTRIFKDGKLTDVINGKVLGWLDGTRFLAIRPYANKHLIHDVRTGESVEIPWAGPSMNSFNLVSDTVIYVPEAASFCAPSTGKTLWSIPAIYPYRSTSDRVGQDFIVFSDGGQLRVENWRTTELTRIRFRPTETGRVRIRDLRVERSPGSLSVMFSCPARVFLEMGVTDAGGRAVGFTRKGYFDQGTHRVELEAGPGHVEQAPLGPLFIRIRVDGTPSGMKVP